ncbi:MAG TPA: ATP-binding protein [Phototrophicaceae bacterium]|nr:ATP-binding protein [Phototrophicaceae bacterium]
MASLRVGIQIELNDSFWVQVEQAVYHAAEQIDTPLELIPIEVSDPLTTHLLNEQGGLVEELLAHNLNALICKDMLPFQLNAIVNRHLPVIYLAETDFQHPRFASPRGLFETSRLVGHFLADKLAGTGQILCAGGLVESNADDGSSRLAGFGAALDAYPALTWVHIPTAWSYAKAREKLVETLRQWTQPIQAIFGLSDTIALAARDVATELNLLTEKTYIAGINGDPLALAAIAEGQMTLTVETPALEFGRKAVQLACRAANGEPIPAHFSYEPHLITADNVSAVALQKLIAIADIPSRMVGVNRRQEQNRVIQLETSVEIARHVGALMDRQTLLAEVSNLIRLNYGYDDVRVFFWSEADQCLVQVLPEVSDAAASKLALEGDAGLLEVVSTQKAVFIPDAHTSLRFRPNPQWPQTRSRAVLPIQFGERLIGILDLHSHRPTPHQRHELIGLQSLASQLGIVMKNAELYAEALDAKARAERADQLKTRLLANVSHELRTPLNVIIGYAQTALATPNPYHLDLPPTFARDLGYIAQSGQHLLHLINDLLSLSQAEIGALELFKEVIPTKAFLEDAFETLAAIADTPAVIWRLNLPERLPMIEADPVRLRQILLNLLHNASKFTTEGQIELGAEIMPPYLHLWVEDSGIGIPSDMQERIFEPFVKIEQDRQRPVGVGLGLTIVRRLVALHGGSVTLESQPGRGSAFHVYLPLPDVAGSALPLPEGDAQPVLLLISNTDLPVPAIAALSAQQKLAIQRLGLADDLNLILRKVRPAALAWDLAAADPDEWRLFERMRAHPQLCQLPLILYGQDETTLAGMTNVLMKPINEKTLINTIRALRPPEQARSILIVDDDPQVRTLYQELAAQALPGCAVQAVASGAAALALLESETPTLIILDLMMPEIDGFTVLDALRANERTRRVPVIVMSGRLLTAEDVRRLDYGQVVFQSKGVLSEQETETAFRAALDGVTSLPQSSSTLVKQALAYIHQNYREPALSREQIAAAVATSKQHLDRVFGKEEGLSVIECLNRFRIERAKEQLATTTQDITTIALQVGFNDSAYFSRVFRKIVGQSPSEYRRQL